MQIKLLKCFGLISSLRHRFHKTVQKIHPVVIADWVSCTSACNALWEECEYMGDWNVRCFSKSGIQSHRGPVWRADTISPSCPAWRFQFRTSVQPCSILYYYFTWSLLAVFSCEAFCANTEVFLARISCEACSVVKTRITGTKVLMENIQILKSHIKLFTLLRSL